MTYCAFLKRKLHLPWILMVFKVDTHISQFFQEITPKNYESYCPKIWYLFAFFLQEDIIQAAKIGSHERNIIWGEYNFGGANTNTWQGENAFRIFMAFLRIFRIFFQLIFFAFWCIFQWMWHTLLPVFAFLGGDFLHFCVFCALSLRFFTFCAFFQRWASVAPPSALELGGSLLTFPSGV